MIQIYCKNCNTTKKFIEGTSLLHGDFAAAHAERI